MKNTDIVNNALKCKFNSNVIETKAISITEDKLYIEVNKILGCKVGWSLSTFESDHLYEYLENKLTDEILIFLFSDRTVWDFCKQHSNLLNWIPKDQRNIIADDIAKIARDSGLQPDIFFNVSLEGLARLGFVSKTIYDMAIAGYFEEVSKHYLDINVRETKYVNRNGNMMLVIVFYNDMEIAIAENFFIGWDFFAELTRENITRNLLSDIKNEITKILVN